MALDQITLFDFLQRQTSFRPWELLAISKNAPKRYKTFTIPKKRGGQRTIAQPARELKKVQKALILWLNARLDVHDISTAYQKGRSIRDNAIIHKGHTPLLKMDLKDFFLSIQPSDFEYLCSTNRIELSASELAFTTNILFWGKGGSKPKCLAIGAPSSPALSNMIMYSADSWICEYAKSNDINVSRYADDITASAQEMKTLKVFYSDVVEYLENLKTPKLAVNRNKTAFVDTGNTRRVTGLILTNDGQLSIGRSRKRLISARVHHYCIGKLKGKELTILRGEIAFVLSADPSFFLSLQTKYGQATLKKILGQTS